ncbi:OmpH family outer membrane protein [Salipiger mucosus]|uniref:Outer membrane protein H n=1 Tax=Salipiger mucosus DSM 16094 TaxID=1123237 RepID=S9RVZ6_9RHOB|nr:OmpH family outer membrane protein [Salipiger mucosus]EPX78154.1 Outer membrane protein H precursor [Salipiger mucosus DSM 16094]
MRRAALVTRLAAALLLLASPLAAQDASGPGASLPGPRANAPRAGVVQSPILTIEFDRVYAESAFGARVAQAIEDEGAEIAAENRRIESELIAEEQDLTDRRATLPPDEFRELADAFDEKVQRLRDEQDAKARALTNRSDERRRQFLALAEPVLATIMREAGAAVILDKRSVFLSAGVIDITELAIDRIDEQIGTGGELPEPDATETAPEANDSRPRRKPAAFVGPGPGHEPGRGPRRVTPCTQGAAAPPLAHRDTGC